MTWRVRRARFCRVVVRGDAAVQLAELLRERGDLDELRARAAAGDWG